MLCVPGVGMNSGTSTLLTGLVMCFPRDQFVPGADTVKTVVALKDLLKKNNKKQIKVHTFYVKVNTPAYNFFSSVRI